MFRMHFLIILLIFAAALGCAHAVKKEEILAQAREIKAAVIAPATAPEPVKVVVPPESPLSAPEKLVYKAKFFGFSIGEFISVNKGPTTLNGQTAYCFELTVDTLPFFGIIKDRYVTYMDSERLVVLRHEEYVDEGMRLESTVDFDYEKKKAFYKNEINGTQKEIPIPGGIHDIIAGGFYLRVTPLELGDTTELNIYADEKIYSYIGLLHSKTVVKVVGRGKQDAYLLKSYLFQDGQPVKGVSAEVFFSMEKYRKPLRAVLKTFWGSVAVVLSEDK